MKNIYGLVLGILFLILSVTTIFATTDVIQSLPPIKQYDCVMISQICGNCTYINISSISYPNSSKAVEEVAMTKNGTEYNYLFCDTSNLGEYQVKGYYDKNGIVDVWTYPIDVTTTGNNDNYVIPLFLGLGAFILLIFAFVLKNNYIGFMVGILFIMLGIYTIIYGLGIMSDLYTTSIAYVSLGLGLFIFLASAYSAINETNVNLFKLGRGDEDDEF
jgi:hypothetical protein